MRRNAFPVAGWTTRRSWAAFNFRVLRAISQNVGRTLLGLSDRLFPNRHTYAREFVFLFSNQLHTRHRYLYDLLPSLL